MKKLRLICTFALLLTTLVGCSSNKSVEVTQKARDLQEQSTTYIETEYDKQVEIAKQYEMNAVLTLSSKYKWNYLDEGEHVTEEETKSLGIYSQSQLEHNIGITKDSIVKKIADYNNSKTSSQSSSQVPMAELKLLSDEKLALSDVTIEYYSEMENNSRYGTQSNSKRLLQIVTVTSSYGVSEYCYTWQDGKVVNATGFKNL